MQLDESLAPIATPHKTKPQALVIEDNRMIQVVHKSFLKQLGFEVQVASNGQEGLAMYQLEHTLVLLDINLPDMDGADVCKQIRVKARGCPVYIIALTAFDKNEVEVRCWAAGVDKIMTKPVMFKELQGACV